MKKITQKLMLIMLLLMAGFGYSQKVAIIGANHATPGNDGFTFVVTQALTAGEVIYFTENEYDNSTNQFSTGEAVVAFTAGSTIAVGNVFFVDETGTNTFTVTCTTGSGCGSATIIATPFALGTDGETLYAYSDNDANISNGVTTIHSAMYTGNSEGPPNSNGGTIPTIQDPSVDYPSAIVVDGFPTTSAPGKVEFKTSVGDRTNVTKLALENPSNYNYGGANSALSVQFFTNLTLVSSNPAITVVASPTVVAENSGTGMVYTFTLSTNAASNMTINFSVGGSAVFGTDYSQTGAVSFNTTSGTVQIPSGSNTASMTLTPTGDAGIEPYENIVITITSGSGYDIGSPGAATSTITNDDTSNNDPLVALVGVSHTDPDAFSFVATKDIAPGTVIYFTENSFNNTTHVFGSGEAVLSWTSPASTFLKGNVVVVTETGTTTNVFNTTCSGGSCGTIAFVSGDFSIATSGETMYAYADSDNNPSNGITDIYSVLFTGTSTVTGGNIPAIEDPSVIYSSALVVDGFASTPAPARTEYNPAGRGILVTDAIFENPSNWVFGQGSPALSTTPFANINVTDAVPPTAVCQNISVTPDLVTGSVTVTGAQIDNGSSDNVGIASLSVSPNTFTCANVGTPVTVTLTVTDTSGNTATCTATVTVLPNVTPTFTQVAPVCTGGSFTLPTTSNNSITGTWAPAVNNTATTTYTFTPNAGQCALTASMTVVINPLPTTPVITVAQPTCEGGSLAFSASYSDTFTVNSNSGVAFIDIDATGDSISGLADDSEHNITMPSFTFNGVAYTNARVSMNGVIVLGAAGGDVDYNNFPLPTTAINAGNVFLAPFWDDLDIQTAARIVTQTVGNKFIIQYTTSAHNDFTIGSITFQAQLDLVNGQITYVYQDVVFGDTDYDLGASATIGLQTSATSAVQYSLNTASLANGQSITFTPPTAMVSFAWSGPNSFASTLAAPTVSNATAADSGTYSLVVTDVATGCSSLAGTVNVVVAPVVTPTFAQVSPICAGAALSALPTTSIEGITGTWSPALNNNATTTYTFTPAAGQCAATTIMTIVVNSTPAVSGNDDITVTMTDGCSIFNGIYNYIGMLNGKRNYVFSGNPGIKIGFDGTNWYLYGNDIFANNGFVNTDTSSIYPPETGWVETGGCGGSGTMVVDVPDPVVLEYCAGATVADLTATGTDLQWYDVALNGSPLASTTPLVTGTYYVTQTLNGCESPRTPFNVEITPNVTPTFAQVGPVCQGDTFTLATTSDNNVTGTWLPAVNNMATTTYTFTPDSGQCATTAIMTVVVNPTTSNTTTVTVCDTYTWAENGVTYTTSGNYQVVTGCHAEILALTVNHTPVITFGTPVQACGTTTITANVPTVGTNNFTGPFDPTNWSFASAPAASGGSVNTSGAPGSISITSGNNGLQGNANYSITVPANVASFSFNWSYTTVDGANWDRPQVIVNGAASLMSGYNTSGASAQSGTMTVSVTPGQTFALSMLTIDGTVGSGVVTITNFVAGTLPNMVWTASNGGVIVGATNTNVITVSSSGTFTLTANDEACTSSNSINATVVSPQGNPTVFGNNVWNVYAFNSGGTQDTGSSWNVDYRGYYTESATSFDTRNRWCDGCTPSDASGYQGCAVNADNHSWSAKRRGFPSANYSIDIPTHDDEAELWINGVMVWEHVGCCDSHTAVWQGNLSATDTVEYRVTEGVGGSHGVITFNVLPNGPASLTSTYCGATINNTAVTLVSNYVQAAQMYRFRVTNVATGTVVGIVDRPVNSFALSNMPGITLATTYMVDVTIRVNNVWSPFYGSPCTVTTPTPLATIGAHCGTTLTSMGQWIYANYQASVTAYRFRITNVATSAFTVYDALNGLNKFNFNQLPVSFRTAGTVFAVEVALRNTDGTYMPYGAACNVTTPGLAPIPTRVEAPNDNFAAVAYPNPFAENFMFDVQTTAKGTIQVRVYDMLGKQIEDRNVEVSDINTIQFGDRYASGVYNVIISQGEHVKTLRVIKR